MRVVYPPGNFGKTIEISNPFHVIRIAQLESEIKNLKESGGFTTTKEVIKEVVLKDHQLETKYEKALQQLEALEKARLSREVSEKSGAKTVTVDRIVEKIVEVPTPIIEKVSVVSIKHIVISAALSALLGLGLGFSIKKETIKEVPMAVKTIKKT